MFNFNRSFSHITPRYTFDRLAVIFNELKRPEAPWLTSNANAILNDLIKPADIGVEFGSGRSTIWFAKRLRHLTSIENDPNWFNNVSQRINSISLSDKVDYRLCQTNEEYAAQADTFIDSSIDFCLIDGLVRDKCAMAMLPKIKPGGILVIDNIERYLPNDHSFSPDSRRSKDGFKSKIWQDFFEATKNYRRIWTSNGVSDTAIWLIY